MKTRLAVLTLVALFSLAGLLAMIESAIAGTLPEYTAAEAKKHIEETATVVGRVDCIDHGRRHKGLLFDGCFPNPVFCVVRPEDASGPELDAGALRGVAVAVTGKITSLGGIPQTRVKKTSQIVPQTKPGTDHLQRGNEKEPQSDATGAMAEYDKAVGTGKRDYAGVITDSSRPIELLTDHFVSHPNDHLTLVLAQAYSGRGEAKEAMGDPAGAITDYENSVRNDPNAPIYKNKLQHAQAQAGPDDEQSSNKSEVTSESIAETFVQAYSGVDVDALASLYADRVDYTNSGVISNSAVRAQAKEYFARWPVRQWSLIGSVKTVSFGATKQKVIFSASYDASNPQTNKHASGIAQETLILASDKSGAIKIASQKEQTSKNGSGQSGEEISGKLDLKAGKAEASKKQPVANLSQPIAPAQAQTGSPGCPSNPKSVWSEASPDQKLLATIRFVQNPDQNRRACDELKITVFRPRRDGKPGQILASSAILGCFLQCAHWSPDSQFLLFTTSLSRGAHGGWHYATFVYCAGDHSFRGDLEDVFGNVLAPDFHFEPPDIAVLTVSDDPAPSTAGEEPPTKQVRVTLGKVVDKLDRLPRS